MKNHDYKVAVLEEDPAHILKMLRGGGTLMSGNISEYQYPGSFEEEEEGFQRQALEATTVFERNRTHVRGALRAILGHVSETYQLPKSGGLDCGAGATGEMVHQLLKERIQPSGWAEIEVNPRAVQENKRRHPQANVQKGSYHRLTTELGLNGNMDIVTGLSSLDATAFLEHAVDEIAGSLKPGGYLLHMQDVRPGTSVCLQRMEQLGIKPPFAVETVDRDRNAICAYKTPDKILSVTELFRQRLEEAIRRQGNLDLELSNWMLAERPVTDGSSSTYYMNMLFKHLDLEHKGEHEETYAVVTLARKR
jgi:hypothetical protein